jgi:glycosyltransferase involved in cell wall biosynthesis
MSKILVLDFCNYDDYQIGGHLSMAKNLISAFGNDLTLVGITTDKNDPVGRWFVKNINGINFDYFALAHYDKSRTKHLIPDRLACYILLRYYRKKILETGIRNVFVQRHEIMLVLDKFGFKNVCYCFPGLESPLGISKYWYSKYIAEQFDKKFFRGLKKAQLVLASGDEKSIGEMVQRSRGIITKDEVKMYPTRINTEVFKPLSKSDCRKKLGMPEDKKIICTTGRLAWLKGWKFMIDYLNASDIFIMGSYKEGWSTALSEAVACGIPAVVTDFSSARDIIVEGRNGHVIGEHNEILFAEGMVKALKIPLPVYNENVLQYSTDRFKDDLLSIWKLI